MKAKIFFILLFFFSIFIMFQLEPPPVKPAGGPTSPSPGVPIQRPYPKRFTSGIDELTFEGGDTTPDVTNGGSKIYHRWGIISGATPVTITQFDDGSGVTQFKDGDWFTLDLDNSNVTIDFSSAYIEGNMDIALTGSTTYPVTLFFEFEGGETKFRCTNFNHGVSGASSYFISNSEDIIPATDDTYDLGDSTHEWKDIYINGIGYIDEADISGASLTGTSIYTTGNIAAGTYGSDWSVSDAELRYVDATSSIQTQLDGKESHTSNDIDPDRIAGDDDDDNLLDQEAMEMSESGTTDIQSGETNEWDWEPNPYKMATYRLTGTLSDPVRLLISETDNVGGSFSEGDWFIVVNAGTPVIEIGDIDGQQEVLPSGGTVYLAQNGKALIIYSGSSWHVSPLATDRMTFDTINARVKTFSSGGVAGTYQFSSISGVTYTFTESEACGRGIHYSSTSGYYLLPNPDPGSGYAGELGKLTSGATDIQLTVTDSSGASVFVNGVPTVAKTGAVINPAGIGDYFVWEDLYVAEYGWRWCINTKENRL